MAPLSLKVVQDDGAVTRTVKLDSKTNVNNALSIIKEKFLTPDDGKEYGLFLTSADNDLSGVWLEGHRCLDYYMLRDGDQLYYLCKRRNLRVRMLDGAVKTMQVDESKPVEELMIGICGKIGITNHDEYGLCHDEEEMEEGKPAGNVGTLTLKRVREQKEKDAKLEQLSKKLKTDDNVQWLDQHKTLREMAVGPKQTLLLKRRLFFSDRNVDARDPVQLNLLYVQARDAILDGRHPVTEEKAVEFAGIQCQIHYGDFQEDKHKAGLIENLREYLPEQYATSWGIEKKILKDYKKHQGISPIDAKYLYTKTARDLPTYGVTFFLVKEKQKGKKKLIPRLLGINANAILRLDEVTKEILQEWPLTQVKSYQVGKSETFTLNFGDYSDKEYCVKTNDAVRIRDILQGYIDIIGKRMAGAYNTSQNEQHTIGEDMIMVSRGNVMQHVANNPSKIVEESFVGPSKLITYEPGQTAPQGTHLVTVQQMMVTNMGSKEQFAVSGEVPVRKDMSSEFIRRLRRMSSNSVKIVTALTDPNENSITEAQKTVDIMQADLPLIIAGVKETAEKQTNEDAKKKILDELQELCDYMNSLSTSMQGENLNAENAEEAAKKIADLSTRMYLSMDPGSRKRSEFCRRSRNSFLRDEKKDAAMRRASFIAAAAGACSAVDDAKSMLEMKYQGAKLTAVEEEQLEKTALDKMGKLNAAVALYLMAHADPNNIDYSAGVTSMNTINELMPDIAKDAQVLSSCKDVAGKQALLDDMKHLFEATRLICSLTGCTDHEKIQEVASNYADISGKLIFSLSRGANDDRDNKIIDLSKDVGDKTSLLLMKAKELTSLAPLDPAATDVDDAERICTNAARDLLACAMLTAPSIHEPHCQSALTAAAETLSSSAQKLIAASKPIIDDPSRHQHGDELRARGLDLAKALDKLKNSYGNTQEEHDHKGSAEQEIKRLKFIASVAKANKGLEVVEKELKKPPITARASPSSASTDEVEKDLAQKLAQINSAVAALITAASNREKPDYATAELALNTINELMLGIVKDTKTVSATKDDATRAAMLADIKELCECTRAICGSADSGNIDELNESAAKFANTSNKLFYMFSPLTPDHRERMVIDILTSACAKTSQMLANVYQLAEVAPGEIGADLDGRGAEVADAAKALLTSAQLTAACIEDPRCQSVLIASGDALSLSAHNLAQRWSPLLQDQKHAPLVKQLNQEHRDLQQELDKLRKACQDVRRASTQEDGVGERLPNREQLRLQYITSLRAAKDSMSAVEEEFDKPLTGNLPKGEAAVVRELQMSQRMAQLNAALAALVAATADRDNPDYAKAEQALNNINELMPQVVKDTKVIAGCKDAKTQAVMMKDLRALVEAIREIHDGADIDPKKFNDMATKFANASSKLIYVVNPRTKPNTASQVIEMAQAGNTSAHQLVKDVNKLAAEVDTVTAVNLTQCGQNTGLAADALLTAAQLTAPCISEPTCQAALVSSAEKLAASAHELSRHWALVQDPIHKPYITALEKKHQQLMQDLEKLLSSCCDEKVKAGPFKTTDSGKKEQYKRQFGQITTDAKKAVMVCEKELDKPVVGTPPKGEAAVLQRQQLSQRLAQLNAAVAALTTAFADNKNPNHVAAEKAIATIKELMPHIVKNANALTAGKDEATRAATIEELRGLCDAVRDICDNAEKHDAAELNESAAKFANTSNKLYYAFSPPTSYDKEQTIIDISTSACGKAGQMLANVYQLAEEKGGEVGADLDSHGAGVADSAKALLTSAQLTAACMEEPRCQSVLIASADTLSSAAHDLAKRCSPLLQDHRHAPVVKQLNQEHDELQKELDKLRKACQDIARVSAQGNAVAGSAPNREQQRLQYIATLGAAKNSMRIIDEEFNKPVTRIPQGEAAIMRELQTAQRITELNAALAALAAATADRDNLDYAAAEQVLTDINELMPHVVKDMKVIAEGKDVKTRAAMMEDLRALIEATRGICDGIEISPAKFNNLATRFADASSKLIYVVNLQAKPNTASQVIEIAQATNKSANLLVKDINKLASEMNVAAAVDLVHCGHNTSLAADALFTAAQLTAPCISDPRSQAALVSSADKLAASAHELSRRWALVQDPVHKPYITAIKNKHQQLMKDLDKLMGVCNSFGKGKAGLVKISDAQMKEQNKLQFTNTAAEAKKAVMKAEKEINKPVVGSPPKGEAAELQRLQLLQRLSQLNAALAALTIATADDKNPDYVAAEKAIATIKELMPHVAKNANALSASKDEATRTAAIAELRALCDVARDICENAEKHNTAKLNNYVSQKAVGTMGKLYYIFNPDKNRDKENEIVDLSKSASKSASQLMSDVNHLAKSANISSPEFDVKTAAIAEAAKALLITVQHTGPYIHEVEGQSKLIFSADALSAAAKDLLTVLTPILKDPRFGPKLREAHQGLEMELEKLRRACRDSGNDKGIVHKTVYHKDKVPLPNSMEIAKSQFVKSVEDGIRVIKAVEEDIKKAYSTDVAASPVMNEAHPEQVMSIQKNIEDKLAQANAAAATLLACNTPDSMDFATASKTTNVMVSLMPDIAKEAKILSNSLADKDRKAFLDDILALFDSTKKLCDVANNDRKKLNEVAMDFSNKSEKLLYAVDSNIDPNGEKQVMIRAKEIGDNTSRIVMCSAELVNNVDDDKAKELSTAVSRCAEAAGTLVYTAKLVALSIQNPKCQASLRTAAQSLSSKLKSFSKTWQPLSANPKVTGQIQQLSDETAKLEKLLGELSGDIETGKLMVKKVKLIVEDTPLRMLASAILGNAKKHLTSTTISPERRQAYVEYIKVLEDGIKEMDYANAVCQMSPHDLEKRKVLEDAVQNLQVVTLQMRPALADKPLNNIVDLSDFVKDVSNDAEQLMNTTNQCSSVSQGIKDYGKYINVNALRIINPDNAHNRGDGTTIDDISEVDLFGQDCVSYVKKLNTEIDKMPDLKDKKMLFDKVTSLEHSCNMLRFATQSAIATTQSASLDETLNDLTDLEKTIDQILAAGDKRGLYIAEPIPWSVCSNLVLSARSGATHPQLATSLAAYVDEQRARTNLCDPAEKNKLNEHLKKLMHLLKVMTVTRSRRVATWQEVDGPEVTVITEQIIKEIYSSCDKNELKKEEKSVLQNIDLNKLLLSSEDVKIEGDRKHVEDKLQQTATKLSSMSATIIASAQKPETLARSLHVTADTATNLAALARALKKEHDPIYNAKIEKATREMTLQAYNVIKLASELTSQDSNNPVYRRRLLDAVRLLNDALNKLGRTASPENKLQRECNELTRNMQLQQSLLQGLPQPTSSLPYSDCVDALQSQHEVIQKLNNDQPMAREEFCRSLSYVTSAVSNSTEIAAQCAYFLALQERDLEVAKTGVVDVQRLQTVTEATQNICYRILRFEPEQAKEEEANLIKQVGYLKQAVNEAADKSKHLKEELTNAGVKAENAAKELQSVVNEKIPNRAKIATSTLKLLDVIKTINSLTEHPSLVPKISDVTADAHQRCDDILKNSRDLTSKTISLIREVKTSDNDRNSMTWVTFNTSRKDVLKVFEALVNTVKENGKRAGVLELSQSELEEETEVPKKTYVQIQVELANKWLKYPSCKLEIKSSGETACQKVVEIAEKMANVLKGAEQEEINHITAETKQLLADCSKKYDAEKSRILMERLKALRKCIERGVVTMVVEEFIEGEEPLADLEILVDAEKDESRRKFLLERKIAELLAQLGRVTKTARFVADSGSGGQTVSVELKKCSDQAELLAPMLVKAAQERITAPNDTAVIEKYKSLLAQYAESLSKVRDLCDQSVDPMEFVQTAGETMQKMREESSHENDPYKCAYASTAITKLANRVIHVSMSSNNVKHDPELQKALTEAQKRISAAVPSPNTRRSKLPDWKVTTAEMLRTTGEVESMLGGEIIFQKQPEPDQPIFAAAAGLHAAVRDWSAKDNEMVAVAKRMAVLMAKLSEYMNTNKKRELIVTSKAIAAESHEVTELARKLAHECTDIRIKTNLLKTCEKIPTISGQLKMLTTVKGSSLGRQGSKEDQEDINMLVDNAQNLMLSIQEVVKVAAGASVKIMSQRGGPRVRWVRKNYYY